MKCAARRRWQALCCLWCCLTFGIAQAAPTYSSSAAVFNWIDPAAHTAVVWTGAPGGPAAACTGGSAAVDDDISEELPLGFTFNYGGVNYTGVRIMSNGRLQFNNTFCGYGTQTTGIPRTYPYPPPNANLVRSLRAYSADFDPGAGGAVTYAATGSAPSREFVVTWTNVPEWGAAGSFFNLQVIVRETGEFIYQYGASNNTSQGKAEIGWEITTTDYASHTYTNIGALANTALRFFIPAPVAYYAMEEGAWGAVLDSSGNALDGTVFGAAQTVAGGRVCRGGDFPLNTDRNIIDAVATGVVADTMMQTSGSINFWYKGNTAWNDGVDRMLVDGTINNGFPFFVMKTGAGRLRLFFRDTGNNNYEVIGPSHNYAANTWRHIAITWSM
jgi:hypothetical protein